MFLMVLSLAASAGDVRLELERVASVRGAGDLAGAEAILAGITEVSDEDAAMYAYQQGITAEFGGRWPDARRWYDTAIARAESASDDPTSAADAHFRLALVLEQLGEADAALEQMVLLASMKGLPTDDANTVSLQRGIALLLAGRARSGVRVMNTALAANEGSVGNTYLRSKACYFLAATTLDAADRYPLTGSQRRIVRHLGERVRAIQSAEAQITTLIAWEEPEWILRSLLRLGDGFTTLADDLDHSPAPHRLHGSEIALYHTGVATKTHNLRMKAWHAYDQGIQLAERLQFESPQVQTLKQRRAEGLVHP